jgi:hypothetical protein
MWPSREQEARKLAAGGEAIFVPCPLPALSVLYKESQTNNTGGAWK